MLNRPYSKNLEHVVIILFILFMLKTGPLFAFKPIAGVIGVKPGSLRAMNISEMLERQLINVISETEVFNVLNTDLLKDQLNRYGCTEEDCVLAFAKTAGINIIIRAHVDDKGDSMIFNIYSQSIDAPYYGKIVYKYIAEIPLFGLNLSPKEINAIADEHAVYFVSGLLRKYKLQLFIKIVNGEPIIDSEEKISGDFDLYRYESNPSSMEAIRIFKKKGRTGVDKNKIIKYPHGVSPHDEDFIFATFTAKADFIENLFYGRKRELVFDELSLTDTTILISATAPLSALMPLAAPLGYFKAGDFTGLSLWAVNSLPYLYLEYKGLTNRPKEYKDDKKSISSRTGANYRFGLYMALAGGMPLVIDAFADGLLYLAAAYQGKQHYLGNNASAVYLSVVSGGGGFFYKGYRLEGYLYFHLHNILLYLTIKEFSSAMTYNPDTNSYTKESRNKKKAYAYLSGFVLLKSIEITHVLFTRDNIKNGKLLEAEYGLLPALYMDGTGAGYGMQYTLRY